MFNMKNIGYYQLQKKKDAFEVCLRRQQTRISIAVNRRMFTPNYQIRNENNCR